MRKRWGYVSSPIFLRKGRFSTTKNCFLLPLLLAVFLVNCGPAIQAQAFWWGDYHLQGDYFGKATGSDWYADQYLDGTVRLPVFDYRLGYVDLTAGFVLTRGSLGGVSGSAASLGRRGVTLSLFPYRRFPFTLYYEKNSRPALLGAPEWSSTRKGGRLMLRYSWLGSCWVSYDDNVLVQGDVEEDRCLFRIRQNRLFGPVQTALRWESETTSGYLAYPWTRKLGTYDATWRFSDEGLLLSRSVYQDFQAMGGDVRDYDEHLYLTRRLGRPWHVITGGNYQHVDSDSYTNDAYGGSATLYRDTRSWRLFSGGGFFAMTSTQDQAASVNSGSAQAFGGGSWFTPRGWTVTADAAFANQTSTGGNSPARSYRTFHVGVGRTDTMPTWVSRLAFAFKDVSFNRRMAEMFPPGYTPPELVARREEYYAHTRSGGANASADFYHQEDNLGHKSDLFTANGQLQFNSTLTLFSNADWQRDGGGRELSSLYLSGRYNSIKGYTVSLFVGYSSSKPGGLSPPLMLPNTTVSYSALTVGGAFSTRLFHRMPFTASIYRVSSNNGNGSLQVQASGTWSLRDLNFRWIYSYYRKDSGWYIHRIQIDLLRLFRGNAL